MRCVKIGLSVALFSLVAMPAFSAIESPAKIATIQMQKAIQSVAEGKKAQEALKRDWDDRQKKLQGEEKKIQNAMEALRKKSLVIDEKSRKEQEEAIQGQIMRLREDQAKHSQEFQKKDQEISEPILKKIREIVSVISKEKGYTIVMDGSTSGIVYSLDQDDITDEVIKRYDAKK